MTSIRLIATVAASVGFIALLAGCDPAALNPKPDANPLTVNVGEDMFATEEETLTLTAEASGGTPPYVYRWNLEQVPDDPEDPFDGGIVNVPDPISAEIETIPFTVGRYVYRVLATDSAGKTAMDFIAIDVGPTPLRVTIEEEVEDDEPIEAVAAESLTLTAETNMAGDFNYRWEQVSGPDVEFASDDEESIEITPVEPGEVVIRVFVQDTVEFETAEQLITINVVQGDSFLVRVEQPDLLLVDQSGTLSANITNPDIDPDSLTYEWKLAGATDARLSTPNARTTQFTGQGLRTYSVSVTARGVINGAERSATGEIGVVVLPDLHPQFIMVIRSDAEGVTGAITFEFDADAAPKTVANVVRYIDEDFYTNLLWHRIAIDGDGEPFVGQFGGFSRNDSEEEDAPDLIHRTPTHDPVVGENENTLGNSVGRIALALSGGNPDSGTTQIFVNAADNTFLDEQGFTAFGFVVSGMARIDAMFDIETDFATTDDLLTLQNVPVDDITIITFGRAEQTPSDRDEDEMTGAAADETATADEEDPDAPGGR